MTYSKIGKGELRLTAELTAPPTPNPPAAKFASQDAQVRTNAQIKFLYYPLVTNMLNITCVSV